MEAQLKLVEPSSTEEREIASLVARAQGKDKAAFKCLYDKYLSQVYGLCWRLCADKSLAQDACQEVFIQLWTKLDNYRGDSSFSTWLHRVTSNVTISYLRKQRSWWQKMMNIEQTAYAEQTAESSMFDSDLEQWLVKLPERARLVFVLHAIEGFRHEQVADMLDIAVGTSKAQMNRARTLMEGWMNE